MLDFWSTLIAKNGTLLMRVWSAGAISAISVHPIGAVIFAIEVYFNGDSVTGFIHTFTDCLCNWIIDFE